MVREIGSANDQKQKTVPKIQRGLRQNNAWTREKTARLINLYRQRECLWNKYTHAYKSKEKQNQAIADICTALRISMFEYRKKIRYLRNQFSSEMKKLEMRIEESGGWPDDGDDKDDSQYRCHWNYYDSLMFLKNVITPRPGYQNSGGYNYQNPTKVDQNFNDKDDAEVTIVSITRVDDLEANQTDDASTANDECVMDDESHIQCAAVGTPEDKLEMIEEDKYTKTGQTAAGDDPSSTQDVIDKKCNPSKMHKVNFTMLPSATSAAITGKKAYFTDVSHDLQQQQSRKMVTAPALQSNQSTMQSCSDIVSTITESAVATMHLPEKSAELNNSAGQTSAPQRRPTKRHLSDPLNASSGDTTRDQWDVFGEMVAAEFRNLNSDLSRKKLKRKIMQAILDVDETDDGTYIKNAIT